MNARKLTFSIEHIREKYCHYPGRRCGMRKEGKNRAFTFYAHDDQCRYKTRKYVFHRTRARVFYLNCDYIDENYSNCAFYVKIIKFD